MATPITDIIGEVRTQLIDLKTRKFWSDPELTAIMRHGELDLWGAILDIHQEHYLTIDQDHIVLRAGDFQLTGVPQDCFRIQLIEPRDTTVNGPFRSLVFIPRRWNHPDFIAARAFDSFNPPVGEIFYHVTGVGSPIEAPRILVSPSSTSDLPLRMAYNPILDTSGPFNPVPGESDMALKAWTIAFARAKETEGRVPDAGWLAVYQTEKQSILTRLTPRQEQEPEVVDGIFDGIGGYY